ncbi:hypothetical protein KPB05_36500 [Burkholderia gladioli]|uniref:hypothetical protein n=1 Tax=Burkholderia gladioli TaxID=28095 RepID=UPI00286288CB|nr:hypothetical protein [Burkholderia gladioli]MDR8092961.1 hypothetical protein [Burkholderia gladioli]
MHPVSKISNKQATDVYREKEAQLARIGRMRRARRLTNLPPAMALAIGTFFLTYVAYHWLLSHFWRPVIGAPEALALATAFSIYYAKKYKTYDDEIFGILAKYRPVNTDAYVKLQERVRNDGILSDAVLHEWLSHELDAIDKAKSFSGVDAQGEKKTDKSPRAEFMNVKLGPSKVASDDKDGSR